MKKFYPVFGLIGFCLAIALIFFMNKKPELSDVQRQENPRSVQSEPIEQVRPHRYETEPAKSTPWIAETKRLEEPVPSEAEETLKEIKMAKIESFLSHSRMVDEFKFLDEQMANQEAMFREMGQVESEDDRQALEDIRNKLSGEKLMEGYKKAMMENFDENELEHLNEVYQNPAMERLKEAEAFNRTPEGMQELAEHSRTFDATKVAPETLSALKEYVKASGAAENMGEVFDSVQGLVDDPNAAPMGKGMKGAIQKGIEEALLAVGDKMFQGYSPEQIRQVAKLLKDPTVQKENRIKTGYMINVMQDTIGPKLAESLSGAASAGR